MQWCSPENFFRLVFRGISSLEIHDKSMPLHLTRRVDAKVHGASALAGYAVLWARRSLTYRACGSFSPSSSPTSLQARRLRQPTGLRQELTIGLAGISISLLRLGSAGVGLHSSTAVKLTTVGFGCALKQFRNTGLHCLPQVSPKLHLELNTSLWGG